MTIILVTINHIKSILIGTYLFYIFETTRLDLIREKAVMVHVVVPRATRKLIYRVS